MMLVLDNFDSFTYNLVQLIGCLNPQVVVKRSVNSELEAIKCLQPSHVVISPGPKDPCDAGISCAVIEHFAGKVPLLGVCLGHQAIASVFGAQIVAAPMPVHGHTASIQHCQQGLFRGVKQGIRVARYHSLVIDPESLPSEFDVIAHYGQIIMGIQHKVHRGLVGIQFHPESFLTESGVQLMRNFLQVKV